MSHYRRANTAGATYFFTVVSYRRQAILCDQLIRKALREAIERTRVGYPFRIDAWVLLPDYLHCMWTLPDADANFASRWGKIKRQVSLACGEQYKRHEWISGSKKKHRESTVWQRRYWEHQIRDQEDFNRYLDYIHCNPVKHGLCDYAIQWPYSTLHRFVKAGKYPKHWAVGEKYFGDLEYGE